MAVQKYLNKHTNLALLDPRKLRKSTSQPRFLSRNKESPKKGQYLLLNRKPVQEELQCISSCETGVSVLWELLSLDFLTARLMNWSLLINLERSGVLRFKRNTNEKINLQMKISQGIPLYPEVRALRISALRGRKTQSNKLETALTWTLKCKPNKPPEFRRETTYYSCGGAEFDWSFYVTLQTKILQGIPL